jgi:hypothetical protein
VSEAGALLRFLLADCEAAAVAEGAVEPLSPLQSLEQLIGEAGAEHIGVPLPPPPPPPPRGQDWSSSASAS